MNSGHQEINQETKAFLARFRTDMGFDFFATSDLIRMTMNKAIKRGRLANDVE
ncbi:hypothetical protein PGA1_c03570 [Phaeobacter inhibens DSM 17395]|nr:hypothetical protein PGA1_c03570 [Phaeobacter inhibens DSM 17395]